LSFSLLSQSNIGGIINSYTKVNYLTVESSLNPDTIHVTSANSFYIGDKGMIYQAKGAEYVTIDNQKSLSILNSGLYEIFVISEVDTVNDFIVTTTALLNGALYDPSQALQLIRVPHYDSAIVTTKLICPPFDGTKGGVIALICNYNLRLNADIDASEAGFRGAKATIDNIYTGSCSSMNPIGFNSDDFLLSSYDSAGLKGEGIMNISTLHLRGKGPAANAGGGGNGKGAGGYGGGLYGEGGRGGNEIAGCNTTYTKPSGGNISSVWFLNTSTYKNRLFLGGGGGASVRLTGATVSNGGNGGGAIIIIADTITGNGKSIISVGTSADTAKLTGAGGGGAGGILVLDVENYKTPITVNVSGGKGGNISGTTCAGPGGGGGGGLIWTKKQLPFSIVTVKVAPGTSGSSGSCTANGASIGSKGDTLSGLNVPLNGFLFNIIHGDQDVCSDETPDTLTGTQPRGGTGNYSYLWIQKSDHGSWDTAVSGSYNKKFLVFNNLLNDTFYFRRIITSGIPSDPGYNVDSGNVIKVNVLPSISNNFISGSDTLCYGKTAKNLSGLSVSGGNGLFNFTWQKSTDSTSWINAASTPYSYSAGSLYDTTYFRRKITSHVCSSLSNIEKIIVLKTITNNIISGTSYICKSQQSDTLIGSIPMGGTTVYAYYWNTRIKNNPWQLNSTNTNFHIPGTPLDTMYYRRIVYSGSDSACIDTSNVFKIQVLEPINNNNISTLYDSVCKNSVPLNALQGATPTKAGGISSYIYEWHESIDSISWVLKSNNNLLNYTPDSMYSAKFFRRIVNSIACNDTSNVAKLNVFSLPASVLNSFDSSICSNESISLIVNVAGHAKPWKIYFDNGYTITDSLLSSTSLSTILVNPRTTDSLATFNYKVNHIKDFNNCISHDSISIGSVNIRCFGYPITNAGQDKEICSNQFKLEAIPSYGNGIWKIISRKGTSELIDSTQANTKLIVDSAYFNKYQLVWKEVNYKCSSKDTLSLEFYTLPLNPAGSDFTLRFSSDTNLNAIPFEQKDFGFWTWMQGQGTINDINDPEAHISNLEKENIYSLTWTLERGVCNTLIDTITIFVDNVLIPGGFSPNNDGINDNLVIDGITKAKFSELIIFNSWGNLIYNASPYLNNWDGKYKDGSDVPDGTYYYILKAEGDFISEKKGFFIIKRQ